MCIYCAVCFFWMEKTVKLTKNGRPGIWFLSWTVDIAIIPVSVLLVVLWHNYMRIGETIEKSTIENFFLVWLLLNTKHIIFRMTSKDCV
jgi:hypothetical protein